MSNIIAICGAKRSGKDMLAKHIVSTYKYKKISFAEPLKKAIKELFNFNDFQVGINEEDSNGDEKDIIDERWGITPRRALQYFGTEIMQNNINQLIPNIDKGFFANILLSFISSETDNYVISDMRFLHEYNKLKNSIKINSLIIIKINRPSIKNNIDFHISENEYIDIPHDLEIMNDGTINDLTNLFDIFYERRLQ